MQSQSINNNETHWKCPQNLLTVLFINYILAFRMHPFTGNPCILVIGLINEIRQKCACVCGAANSECVGFYSGCPIIIIAGQRVNFEFHPKIFNSEINISISQFWTLRPTNNTRKFDWKRTAHKSHTPKLSNIKLTKVFTRAGFRFRCRLNDFCTRKMKTF